MTLLGLKEKKISAKIDFCIKTFLNSIYFDVISQLNTTASQWEATESSINTNKHYR